MAIGTSTKTPIRRYDIFNDVTMRAVMDSWYYLNGKYLLAKEAKIDLHDLGYLRGYGIFDYLRTYQGKPFHLWDHLQRLKYSLEKVHLQLPCSLEGMAEIVWQLVEKNRFPETSIKLIVSGGLSSDQLMPTNKPTFCVLAYPFIPFSERFYQEGIRLITTELSRPLPDAKTTCYLPAIISLKKAKERHADDALYLNQRRELLEATTSNLFAVKGGTLITSESEEILYGITREVVLRIAVGSFPLEIRPIPYAEIPTFDEMFVCSSNREIMPVSHIDNQTVGKGVPGPITTTLQELFRSYTLQPEWQSLDIARYCLFPEGKRALQAPL